MRRSLAARAVFVGFRGVIGCGQGCVVRVSRGGLAASLVRGCIRVFDGLMPACGWFVNSGGWLRNTPFSGVWRQVWLSAIRVCFVFVLWSVGVGCYGGVNGGVSLGDAGSGAAGGGLLAAVWIVDSRRAGVECDDCRACYRAMSRAARAVVGHRERGHRVQKPRCVSGWFSVRSGTRHSGLPGKGLFEANMWGLIIRNTYSSNGSGLPVGRAEAMSMVLPCVGWMI